MPIVRELTSGGNWDIDRAPFEPTVNQRLQQKFSNDMYAGHILTQEAQVVNGVGGYYAPAGDMINGAVPRKGTNGDGADKSMGESIAKGAGNMAVSSAEGWGVKAGLVALGVEAGPAGWVALAASFLLPKIF